MNLRFKILFGFSAILFIVGGLFGQKDDFALIYYYISWFPALIVGVLFSWICGTDEPRNGIGAPEIFYTGFCIVISVSFLFHRSDHYVIGRICAIVGATIFYHLSKIKG